ncbi:hypothetical protein DV702_04225 [Sporosarcina sp. PTS2304]|uniref:hypothetical protein n=1 Tax=Sporosarcina sp. PTS2304 TaxID=2283194 RepID=UPI000E0D61A2|nr:hypothetical protein [Sporosarcina sp. PTS2304]AXH99007.1 hypothetical protein DV702_04225 [Sporosarcina sp. PTS2304]
MDISLLLLIIGVVAVVASFFVGSNTRVLEDELEKVSISLHQETSNLKKRVRVLEEELMIAAPAQESFEAPKKPVHAIIVNQITSLHKQGYTVLEISQRSSLAEEEVIAVLRSKGVRL